MKHIGGQRAFTLVELLVSLTIICVVLLASAPYLSDWTYSRQIKDAQSKLLSGYGLAKALALRNPDAVQGSTVAAGLKVVTGSSERWLYVCRGDPASANCDGADTTGALVWRADFPAGIDLKLGTNSWAVANPSVTVGATLSINNRGVPIGGLLNYYSLTRGGAANDVSGPLP